MRENNIGRTVCSKDALVVVRRMSGGGVAARLFEGGHKSPGERQRRPGCLGRGAEEGGSRVWYLSSTRELSSKVQSRLSLLGKRKCF